MKHKKKVSMINSLLKSKTYKKGFTFVELMISITIIAILSVLWFVSYKWHLSTARDSTRKTELSDIYSLLDAYKIKAPLMVPDMRIDIYSSWVLIWFQWYLSKDILSKIWFKGEWKDPLDKVFYTYYLTKDLRNPWVMGFLENNPEDDSYLNSKAFSLIPKVYAVDYNERHPIIFWKKLWILLDSTKAPIQENIQIKWLWKIDVDTINDTFSAYFDNKKNITGTGYSLQVLYWTSITWIIWQTCEDYLAEYSWPPLKAWYYLLNTASWTVQAYCPMNWSWSEIRSEICWWTLIANSYPTNWNTYVQSYNWTTWVPILSWNITWTLWCDFNCNSWYNWNWTSCMQIINWACWYPNWYWVTSSPSWPLICSSWNPSAVVGSWPRTWDCNWTNSWTTANCSTLTTNWCMVWRVFIWCEVH